MKGQEELINKIIDAEWEMFHNVDNIGGPASCQQDQMTFRINRFAQAVSWSESMLESYLNDLAEAKNSGRNLMAEKYGRMMESTLPQEYAKIKSLLPRLASEVPIMIEEIVGIILKWEEVLLEKYPNILQRGRPIYTTGDTPDVTSIETYLRGELATYSLRTLRIYHENILKQKSERINASELTLEYMMKSYGFKSAREANEKLGRG